ncbi:hypothetical protein [Streptomyces sp. NPDC001100]
MRDFADVGRDLIKRGSRHCDSCCDLFDGWNDDIRAFEAHARLQGAEFRHLGAHLLERATDRLVGWIYRNWLKGVHGVVDEREKGCVRLSSGFTTLSDVLALKLIPLTLAFSLKL